MTEPTASLNAERRGGPGGHVREQLAGVARERPSTTTTFAYRACVSRTNAAYPASTPLARCGPGGPGWSAGRPRRPRSPRGGQVQELAEVDHVDPVGEPRRARPLRPHGFEIGLAPTLAHGRRAGTAAKPSTPPVDPQVPQEHGVQPRNPAASRPPSAASTRARIACRFLTVGKAIFRAAGVNRWGSPAVHDSSTSSRKVSNSGQ